ncbi:MAG: class I SAM-dependent DNA methyltransferase, partial [Chloroflexota bacterium]|nr:class I SAM-dependent DNA methyltransferase [Chloroflexota bacterium]
MAPTFSPQAFVAKWRGNTRKERSAAQEHFIDLCRLVGHPTPGEAGSANTYDFEAGAGKQKGGSGWADVWKQGYFAWEYKGKHADLDKAYQQLLQYREALQNPPLLVVSDLDRIVIHTNFTNTVKQVTILTLDDLLTPAGQQHLRNVFYAPEAFKARQTTAEVTQDAAKEFARLADLLRRWGEPPDRAAHFLIRLLFCLFAEDIGLLPNGLLTRLIERTHMRPHAFAQQLRHLFAAMSTGGWFGEYEILYFNGGLFDDDVVLELDSEGMDILSRVSRLDWSSIEPSILGTLFERSLDPGKRSQLGAHYTSKDDILLIVEPVLMAPLRRRWAEVKARAETLADRRQGATAAQRTRIDNEIRLLLTGFAHEIASVKVLDPACGSGNFLYVALKQLLDLEKEVITAAGDLQVGLFFPSVSPEQLRGIELNEYAHELTQITVWIGYIQWLRDNGFGEPSVPILKPLDTIVQMDAILAFDEQGRVVEPAWPAVDIIIGNPPFLGGKRLRTELGDENVDHLFALYAKAVPREADLVCYWFERTRAMIEARTVSRAGLLATQGIRGGANRKVLERIKQTGDIFWAQSDRNWILNGATVHVSMIAFDRGEENFRVLDGSPVNEINADLTSSTDVSIAKRLDENRGFSYMGVTPAGPFDVPGDLARQWLAATGNPNGKPNFEVVRPYYNGHDIMKRPRDVWIIDFGPEMSLDDASQYEAPFEYAFRVVRPLREQSRIPNQPWWLFTRSRPAMRAALAPLTRYIATSMVAKHRCFAWIPQYVLPGNLLIVIARDDDYSFGVLHSRPHELWGEATGTQLREAESGKRYTPTTTFETFPFPSVLGQECKNDPRIKAISTTAQELVEKRDRWLNPEGADEVELKKRTLTKLYNERPTWLDLAHKKLDQAVLDAYGWPHDISDDEILARLLALNLERAAQQGTTQ